MLYDEACDRDKMQELKSGIEYGQSTLIEKVYRALSLLEGLAQSKLDFIFKGGTAVMLLTGKPERFSIDIDIIHKEPIEKEVLMGIASTKGFLGVQQQERKVSTSVPKSHYLFNYKPLLDIGLPTDTIILDVLHEDNPYTTLVDTPVAISIFPQIGEPVRVKTPNITGICGDKLTAFAPNTIGIPYKKSGVSATLEIAKQLFDIGLLFDMLNDAQDVHTNFSRICTIESSYRSGHFSETDILHDVLSTALCIASEGSLGSGDYQELKKGIISARQFIFSHQYNLVKAGVQAAKAAYLSALFHCAKTELIHYVPSIDMKDFQIHRKPIDRLKKSNPEAFYYWYQVFRLLEKHSYLDWLD
jgi:hypothetical protein